MTSLADDTRPDLCVDLAGDANEHDTLDA